MIWETFFYSYKCYLPLSPPPPPSVPSLFCSSFKCNFILQSFLNWKFWPKDYLLWWSIIYRSIHGCLATIFRDHLKNCFVDFIILTWCNKRLMLVFEGKSFEWANNARGPRQLILTKAKANLYLVDLPQRLPPRQSFRGIPLKMYENFVSSLENTCNGVTF